MVDLRESSPFGVMFHHFYNNTHPRGQGAISSIEFEEMICWLQKRFTILTPDEFIDEFLRKGLNGRQICLTFDDSLLCQYDVAIPVLESMGLKAFFNVYSSAFSGNPDPLEIFRYFRTVAFGSIAEFYSSFFEHLRNSKPEIYKQGLNSFQANGNYLDQFPFYSLEDKMFRFFRDRILGKADYILLMRELIQEMNFDVFQIPEKVFMSTKQLVNLVETGHRIGLHSDSHPTEMSSLSRSEQTLEYARNYDFIQSAVGIEADSMAHPCGSYNKETIQILRELGIAIGFGSSMNANKWGTEFEVPREDHMTIHSLVRKF
jgi:peptidoglycan/xylan/chitin deacetylase (PgdA/CDA1 family)